MKTARVALVLLLCSPLTARAEEGADTGPRRPPPLSGPSNVEASSRTGALINGQVFIGERAPDFELDGSRGKPVKLSSMRGDWLLLVFADRKEDLLPMQQCWDDLRPLGVQVLGVCNEKARSLETFSAKNPLPYALLADVTGDIASLYGLFDRAHSNTRPGFVVLDRAGVVRMAVLGQQLPVGEITRLARFAVTGS